MVLEASAAKRTLPRNDTALHGHTSAPCCPNCGFITGPSSRKAFTRGALTVRLDPPEASWQGRSIPLSPTEAHVFVRIAARGRLSFEEIDEAIAELGCRPATRSIVIFRTRRKFEAAGACNPLMKIPGYGFALSFGRDVQDRGSMMIGLEVDKARSAAR